MQLSLCKLTKRPKATSAPRPIAPRPPPLYTFFDASRHTVFQTDTRLICSFCSASVPTRNRAQAVAWLQSPCTPTVVRIGTKSTHPTHTLRSLRGVLFCVKCGAVTTQQLKALAAPCRCSTAAYAPPHAKTTLKRLANGDLPHGVKLNNSMWSTIWHKAWDRMVDSSRTSQASSLSVTHSEPLPPFSFLFCLPILFSNSPPPPPPPDSFMSFWLFCTMSFYVTPRHRFKKDEKAIINA